MKPVSSILKRLVDVLASTFGLLLCAPILLLLSVLVRLFLGSPVFFRQRRPGRFGKPFTIVKFRTMTNQAGTDAERLTRFGLFLRSTSLDELPELWNVLKGEMSLVGPRPLLMQHLERYTPEQTRRHEVRPGITGWAQIRGRNAQTWEERFTLDVWYVDHWSLWIDVKILWTTVFRVLRRSGVNAPGEATMPEFMGSEGRRREDSV